MILYIIATNATLGFLPFPRFDILLQLPLNLPDSLIELSIPKKATRCFGFRKPFTI